MSTHTLETDYLIIGSGASGMAFADSLVAETDAHIIMTDRRAAPGGHWNDAYSFVRLHQPSRYYGVNSMSLGSDTIQTRGPEAGMYERASGAQIRAYYERVMYERLIPSGQVRFFPQCDYIGNHRLVSRLSGDVFEVKVRKKLVDATSLGPSIPASTPPPFNVGAEVTVITVDQLAYVTERPDRYVIIGAGKTALDACVWLLENHVAPDDIQWIKPRETWLLNRTYTQPGSLVGTLLEGLALQMETAAQATTIDDMFDCLEAAAQLRRVDQRVRPTMYRGATIGDWEIDLLRRIENVIRLGHVRRIERNQMVLDNGTIPTTPRALYIHCAADGLPYRPARPIFDVDQITLQSVRIGLVPFNAAFIAFIEAHRDDDEEKNRLCPPNPYPNRTLDWARGMLIQLQADRTWSKEPDILAWLDRSRLNATQGSRDQFRDPEIRQAVQRFAANVGPGLTRMAQLIDKDDSTP